jgi:phosphatidylglycerophosphate synthase
MNFFLEIIYKISYPLALLFKKIGFTPNKVTFFSFFFTLFAFYSLLNKNIYFFFFFWSFAYIFDFVDGTLARITNNIGDKALRIDHISDLVKITIIFLGFGFYFDTKEIWILVFTCSNLYLFYTVLDHELSWNLKLAFKYFRKSVSKKYRLKKKKSGFLILFFLNFFKKNSLIKKNFLIFIRLFFNINGHTLLIFFLIPLNKEFAYVFLIYFIILNLLQILNRIVELSLLKRSHIY